MGRFLVMMALAVQVLGSAGLCAVADAACRGACVGDGTRECGPMAACGGRTSAVRRSSCDARPLTACRDAVQVNACSTVWCSVVEATGAGQATNPPCDRCEPCPLDEPFQAPAGSGHEVAAAALLPAPVTAAVKHPAQVAKARVLAARPALDPGRLRPSICVWVI